MRYIIITETTKPHRKEKEKMSEKEKKILETFEKVLPDLTEAEKEKLLSFGEGMAFMKTKEKKREKKGRERA